MRIACFLSGMPAETSTYVLNRACSSGLQAIASLHSSIQSGFLLFFFYIIIIFILRLLLGFLFLRRFIWSSF